MKQKQHLGVSTHPRVCGFASEFFINGDVVLSRDRVFHAERQHEVLVDIHVQQSAESKTSIWCFCSLSERAIVV